MKAARDLQVNPRPGRPPEPKFYTYRGTKTQARTRQFAALEHHSTKNLQRSQEAAKKPPPPQVPAPAKAEPKPRTVQLPPPRYGGPEGLELAARESAAFDRKAPKSEWPELPRPPLPPPFYGGPKGLKLAAEEAAKFDRKTKTAAPPEPPALEGETPHEIPHPDTGPMPHQGTGHRAPSERDHGPVRRSKEGVGGLLGWAAQSLHARARTFRESRAESCQGRSPGGMDRGRSAARG